MLLCFGEAKPDFAQVGFGAKATGGGNKNVVNVTTVEDLKKYAESAEPATIQISKTLSGGAAGIEIHVKSDKTILGVGSSGALHGIGLHLEGVKNIVIRNLKMTMSTVTKTIVDDRQHTVIDVNGGDVVTVMDSTNIWIDHNEFYNVDPAKNTNKDLYDGLVDITHKCDEITLSWNYFHDHWKCNLIGASDTDNYDRKVTLHHNHWKNIDSRVPSVRFGHAHVYNNLYEHIFGSGVHTRVGACVVVEDNYFDNVKDPLFDETDGPGKFEAKDNTFVNVKGQQNVTEKCTYTLPYKYTLESVSTVK